jgi:hypothetical protein
MIRHMLWPEELSSLNLNIIIFTPTDSLSNMTEMYSSSVWSKAARLYLLSASQNAATFPVWRRVRVLPPKTLPVVRGDGKGTQ